MGAISDILKRAVSSDVREEDSKVAKIREEYEYCKTLNVPIPTIYFTRFIDGKERYFTMNCYWEDLMTRLTEVASEPNFIRFIECNGEELYKIV